MSGQGSFEAFPATDVQYVRDLGLIKKTSFAVANPIYQEIIPRELTWTTQERIQQEALFYVNQDGTLNVSALMTAFTQFFRENSGSWLSSFEYKESGPHLLLMAFLQRIINGGGSIHREYALDRKRVDLLVCWKNQKIVIELKIRHGADTESKGLEQTVGYMDIAGATEGHLVIFDRTPGKTWEEKIASRTDTFASKTIHVWTM